MLFKLLADVFLFIDYRGTCQDTVDGNEGFIERSPSIRGRPEKLINGFLILLINRLVLNAFVSSGMLKLSPRMTSNRPDLYLESTKFFEIPRQFSSGYQPIGFCARILTRNDNVETVVSAKALRLLIPRISVFAILDDESTTNQVAGSFAICI